MKILSLVAFSAMATMTLSQPSFAAAPMASDTMHPTTTAPNAMNGDNMHPSTTSPSAMNNDAMPTTCQGMMDKAKPMMDAMAAGRHKTMAMRQMAMAEAAMDRHHMKTCMSHMRKAMHDMM